MSANLAVLVSLIELLKHDGRGGPGETPDPSDQSIAARGQSESSTMDPTVHLEHLSPGNAMVAAAISAYASVLLRINIDDERNERMRMRILRKNVAIQPLRLTTHLSRGVLDLAYVAMTLNASLG